MPATPPLRRPRRAPTWSPREPRYPRWLALLGVALNVAFNYLYVQLGWGASVKTVSDEYVNLFTPAPYAFAIWGVIYAAFAAFAVIALLPAQRASRAFDRLAGPLLIANVLGILWLTVFTRGLLWPSVAVMAAILVAAIAMYRIANQELDAGRATVWLRIPFALYLGWIAVATIANVSTALVSVGFHGLGLGEAPWAMAMIGVAAALAVAISLRHRDFVVAGVVAWAVFAINVGDRQLSPPVAQVALIAGALCALAAVVAGISSVAGQRSPRLPSSHHGAQRS